MQSGRLSSFILSVSMVVLVLSSAALANNMKDSEEQTATRTLSRFLGASPNLARLFFFNAIHPNERQAAALGLKRSSSALDALTGVTLGKRSEQVNLEPYFGRQFSSRSIPRDYEPRWQSFDSYEPVHLPYLF